MIRKLFTAAVVMVLLPLLAPAQLTLNSGQTALALAQKLAGPGITISNPVLTCATNANGIFKGVSNLGIDSGIVLTTGRASTVGSSYGVNGPSSANASLNNGTAGDPQLATLANSTTFDACKLEFDLVPKGDSIRFDYVFGSEEYNTSTCGTYNDAFAFFISGPGFAGQQNIALVPGTTIPVAVNSINSGVPGSQGNIVNCTSMGAGSPFTAYYVNNATGATITYRGFTTVLKAQCAVQACSTYHLKMTIADAGNALYDSGVFIKAGSLKTNTFSITPGNIPGGAQPFVVKGCTPGVITIKRSQVKPTQQTIKFLIAGTAVNGTDYNVIADSVVIPANDTVANLTLQGISTAPTGPKTIKLLLLSPYSCNGQEIIDSVFITVLDGLNVNIRTADTTICAGQSVNVSVDGDASYNYNWSPSAGLSNANVMQPIATPLVTTQYTLTATLPNSGCAPKKDTLNISVDAPVIVDAGQTQQLCVGKTIQLLATVTSFGGSNYQWTGPAGFISNQLNPAIANATAANGGQYLFTVDNGVCGTVKDSVSVMINPPPAAPVVASPITICLHAIAAPLQATGSNLLWYSSASGGAGAVSITPTTVAEGHFVYYVSQSENQCESGWTALEVIVEKCCDDNIFIPSAFSPNGDGRNDRFNIIRGPADEILQCTIYNRWGQMIFKGLKADVWDGTFGGKPVEPGIYFYDLLINCHAGTILEKKGDITVIR